MNTISLDNKDNNNLNKDIPHYRLDTGKERKETGMSGALQSSKEFYRYIRGDGIKLFWAFIMVLLNSVAGVITPFLIAKALDQYIATKDLHGLGVLLLGLGALYLLTVGAGYAQGMLMGGVAQRTLFRLRGALFEKLQDLPIAFFNQNKAGDLMSRLNNDTDKLSQFLSESIMRFVGSFFVIFGIAVFVFFINFKLAIAMLSSTFFLIIITRLVSPWIEKLNKNNLNAVGLFSASLQENLSNFRVIVAYSKRKYLRTLLEDVNQTTFSTAYRSGVANRVFEPIYDFAGSIALILVLTYGIHLISLGSLTIGLLVAFVSYTQKFYDPLRILATIFGTIQLFAAAWSRIRAVLSMENNLQVISISTQREKNLLHNAIASNTGLRMELRDVSFAYEDSGTIIEDANLSFEVGKTYALVGPTGGGKSTLASLMARLYDPISGIIFLDGKDIRSYTPEERAKQISVILQDPLLFTGTVADNIRYGNDLLKDKNDTDLEGTLKSKGFSEVISRFSQGLSTAITQGSGGGLSIGQKQLISFMRAILRQPKLLILDEATANIDTVTEAILNKAISALPADTTKVIIAHRLNTIKEADEIMFVNGHHVTRAGSFHDAIRLIENSKRNS
jgi:ATP-binding cassette subfamily B protein